MITDQSQRRPLCLSLNLQTCCPLKLHFLLFLFTSADVEDEEPRKSAHKVSKTNDGKYDSLALKFNNNTLTEIVGLEKIVRFLLVNPMELSWLDLSMNDITKLDNVSIGTFFICIVKGEEIPYFDKN